LVHDGKLMNLDWLVFNVQRAMSLVCNDFINNVGHK
jgi:hypothetical protein